LAAHAEDVLRDVEATLSSSSSSIPVGQRLKRGRPPRGKVVAASDDETESDEEFVYTDSKTGGAAAVKKRCLIDLLV
jgi:hypothetical protein